MANTEGFKSTKSFTGEIINGADYCDHVTPETLENAVGYYYERDSFGLAGAEIVCRVCRESSLKEEQEAPVCCHDCMRTVPLKESISWTPYDFYAPQGDVPTIVCLSCTNESKHKARVQRDNDDYQAEFGSGDDDDNGRSPWLR